MLRVKGWFNQQLEHLIQRDASGHFLRILMPAYTSDPSAINAGEGILAAKDWETARTHTNEEEFRKIWYQNFLVNESHKAQTASQLLKKIDLQKYDSIIEFGAGPIFQGAVIKAAHPKIRYCATDFDPTVSTYAAQIELLKDVETKLLDLKRVSSEDLKGFNLAISWAVEYALDNAELTQLLKACANAGTNYLMCTPTTATGIAYARYKFWSKRKLEILLDKKKIRIHGWIRSHAFLKKLATESGLKMTFLGRFGHYDALLFEKSNH